MKRTCLPAIFVLAWTLILCSVLSATPTHSKSLIVNSSQVPSTQTNFTVDVFGTDTDLKPLANGGTYVQNSSGYDIEFFSNSDCSTGKLKWAIILFVPSTGAHHYKVKIASLADGSTFYECFGDSGISTDQSDAANTWDSDTCASWSFPDGTTLSLVDPFGGNNGTNHSATAATGKIDGGLGLSGSSQWVDVGDGSCIGAAVDSAQKVTISAWIKPTSISDYFFVFSKEHTNMPKPYELRIEQTTGKVQAFIGDGNNFQSATGATGVGTGTWHQIGMSYDYSGGGSSGDLQLYLDGASTGSSTGVLQAMADGTDGALIGTRDDAYSYFPGTIDEIQVDKIIRSSNWFMTKKNDAAGSSGFYALGTLNCLSGCSTVVNRRSDDFPRTSTRGGE